jgi:hypothetical protein
MSKTKLTFTGGPKAKYALVADHKGKESTLRVYPILHSVKSGKPISGKGYDKKDAIAVLKFVDSNALYTFASFVLQMRDHQIYRDGISAGKTSMQGGDFEQLIESVMETAGGIEELLNMFDLVSEKTTSTSGTLTTMPEEALNTFLEALTKEKERRETGKDEAKNKVKEEKPVTEAVS